MQILNQEHFENVKRYAESIGDTSLQKCLERLKSWEENPDCPSEISLYYDHAPYSVRLHPTLSRRKDRHRRRPALSRNPGPFFRRDTTAVPWMADTHLIKGKRQY